MRNKIIIQESELDSLKVIVSNRQKEISELNKEISYSNNDMQNKIIDQKSELESLKKIVFNELGNFGKLKSDINNINDKIKIKEKKINNEIKSYSYSVPFSSKINQINLSSFIGQRIAQYEVELINIVNLEFTQIDQNIDFHLTLSTKSLDSNNVHQNGLVSFYQYSKPEKGRINSTSSKLLVDNQNPYIFLEGNEQYKISGELVLKISGKFK